MALLDTNLLGEPEATRGADAGWISRPSAYTDRDIGMERAGYVDFVTEERLQTFSVVTGAFHFFGVVALEVLYDSSAPWRPIVDCCKAKAASAKPGQGRALRGRPRGDDTDTLLGSSGLSK